MKTDFTFGIPEMDHLAGHQIENKSFILLAGNDDDGMNSFWAEIEKSHGRHVEKEEDSRQIIRIDQEKTVFEKFAGGSDILFFEKTIFLIDDLSDFLRTKEHQIEFQKLLEAIKKIEETKEIILFALLYEGILPMKYENKIKHVADIYFQFEMSQKMTEFERTLSVFKSKNSNLSGKILKYVIQDGKFQIENKKRIY